MTGISGHALGRYYLGYPWPNDDRWGWGCSCGAYMGATRAEAREAMRGHRLDLRTAPA